MRSQSSPPVLPAALCALLVLALFGLRHVTAFNEADAHLLLDVQTWLVSRVMDLQIALGTDVFGPFISSIFFASETFTPGNVVGFAVALGAAVALLGAQTAGKGVRAWAYVMGVVVASGLTTNLLKRLFSLDRPQNHSPLGLEDTFGYPSGHATAIAALSFGLAISLRNTRAGSLLRVFTWLLAAALMAWVCASRMLLDLHYPSDILGGILVASTWLLLLRPLLGTGDAATAASKPSAAASASPSPDPSAPSSDFAPSHDFAATNATPSPAEEARRREDFLSGGSQ